VVQTLDQTWRDESRQRDIPVRIHAPKSDATNGKDFPLIMFSHGLGGSRAGGAIWGAHWASHGYVVVHLQHPGSDESIWKDKGMAGFKKMKEAMNADNTVARVQDVKWVLGEVERLKNAGAAPFNLIDLKRVGMSGHSFGAQTTLLLAGQRNPSLPNASARDSRIRAAIAFSPNARVKTELDRQFANITMPLFSITGTADGSVLNDDTRYEDRMLPYQHMPPGGKYLVSFADGDHMMFGGHASGSRRAESARALEIQVGVKAATLAFWNAMLRDDVAAKTWLAAEEGGFKTSLRPGDKFAFK
jgi:predicted dienelactone hydrolase